VSKRLLQSMPHISTQVVAENVNVCLKKFKLSKTEVINHANSLEESCTVHGITNAILKKAIAIFSKHGYAIFDCLIIASALEAGCTTLYSEDLQHKQVIDRKLQIINPFVEIGI
jgi:predicted nucleic acid-binding protein